jgi:putative hydrolase of the HAD superfamily
MREDMTRAPIRMPEAVTFDCWNTLLYEANWEVAHARRVTALVQAAGEAGRVVPRDAAARAFDAAWERHVRIWTGGANTGAREVALWGLAELGLREPHPALEHLVQLEGARDTLAALAAAGVPRALVCDTGLTPGRVVRRHLDRVGLLSLLDVQIFSDELGVPKPDRRVFRAALDPLGVDPQGALHVGDLRRTDVAGARALGMRSVRIRELHDDASDLPDADFVVASHAELCALLALDGAMPSPT